jgi:hypothetical protein
VVAIIAAIVILPGFWLLTQRSPDRNDYNWWQPIISPLPILSFVLLRNSTELLRNYYSTGFAWLGKCSLEMFTLQYHILVAADTKGILSLGVFEGDGSLRRDRWRELLLIMPLFLWASWQVSSATTAITKWFVENAPTDHLPIGAGKRRESRLIIAHKGIGNDIRIRVIILMVALWLLNLVSGFRLSLRSHVLMNDRQPGDSRL